MTIDKDLLKLAEFYGIEITEGNGGVIIMPDGTEKLFSELLDEELLEIMSLNYILS